MESAIKDFSVDTRGNVMFIVPNNTSRRDYLYGYITMNCDSSFIYPDKFTKKNIYIYYIYQVKVRIYRISSLWIFISRSTKTLNNIKRRKVRSFRLYIRICKLATTSIVTEIWCSWMPDVRVGFGIGEHADRAFRAWREWCGTGC